MAVAVHLLLRKPDGQILFMRRQNTGYADGRWSLPAGHVEAGETLTAACVREAFEETLLELDPDSLAFALLQHKHDDDGEERLDTFFYYDIPSVLEVAIGEPEKCDATAWACPMGPPTPVVPYVAAALRSLATDPLRKVNYYGF